MNYLSIDQLNSQATKNLVLPQIIKLVPVGNLTLLKNPPPPRDLAQDVLLKKFNQHLAEYKINNIETKQQFI